MWGRAPDLISCAKFQNEISRGCDSTGGGSKFSFSYWFLNGHYNSAALLWLQYELTMCRLSILLQECIRKLHKQCHFQSVASGQSVQHFPYTLGWVGFYQATHCHHPHTANFSKRLRILCLCFETIQSPCQPWSYKQTPRFVEQVFNCKWSSDHCSWTTPNLWPILVLGLKWHARS